MSSTPTSNVLAEAASRLMTAIAIGAFSTAAAGAGTAIILTGSASPAAWVAAYQHAQECSMDGAAQDPNCSPAAARALAEEQLAAQLEQKASDLKARQTPGAGASSGAGGPAPSSPAAAPAAPAPTTHSDDGGEGNDD
ncbi:MAG TPA: hypothetical protein VFL29_05465 [Candidatus Dormibacteraeota bacterium]|nr:hypothetical protein [Candidatus Dormibacteraeota bacterium]